MSEMRKKAASEMLNLKKETEPILKLREITESEQFQTIEQFFSKVNPEIDNDNLTQLGTHMAAKYFTDYHNKEEYKLDIWGKIKDVAINTLQQQPYLQYAQTHLLLLQNLQT